MNARPTASTITDDQLDALYGSIDAVRALHQPMERGPFTICAHCSDWDGKWRCLGVVTDFPCPTIRALDAALPASDTKPVRLARRMEPVTAPATTLRAVQSAAWANKLAKGFNTTDIALEFGLLVAEIGEAFTAWRRDPEHLGEELADVEIFLVSLAEMTGVDLEAAVARKLAANSGRRYERNSNGVLVKATGDADGQHDIRDA